MDVKKLAFSKLKGISEKALEIHHAKLYAGYVKKVDEVGKQLKELRDKIITGEASGNATYSELRGLKEGETFARNGVYLHENYFDILGGDGDWSKAPQLAAALIEKWGSVENFIKYFSECGMASRGWAVLAWDSKVGKLMQYNGDAHNQGGVWGATPIIALDVYEHSYFIDFGSDRKSYIEAFWKNLNWGIVEELFLKAKK
jgi:Fe-Mn family superoxide dismutase